MEEAKPKTKAPREERRIKLDIIHSFGSLTSKGFHDSVGLIEEDGNRKIIYPVGKFIAIK